jgi:hypothetical protein
MKVCGKCGEAKPLEEFYSNGVRRKSFCKPCHIKAVKARSQTPEGKATRRRYERGPGYAAILARRKTPEGRVRWKDYKLRYDYGVTLEQFNAMIDAQGGRCFCGEPFGDEFRNRPVVDHCHKTGRVRGILHHLCNWHLGQNDPELLRKKKTA